MTLSNGQTEPHPPTSSVVSTAGICLAFNPAMRALCLAAAAVGVATAFTPNSLLATRTLPPSTAHQIRNRAATPSFTDAAQPRSHRRELRASEGAQGRGQHGSAEAVGVIVCDHGSRRANANEMLFEVAERYRSFAGFEIVEVRLLTTTWYTAVCVSGAGVVLLPFAIAREVRPAVASACWGYAYHLQPACARSGLAVLYRLRPLPLRHCCRLMSLCVDCIERLRVKTSKNVRVFMLPLSTKRCPLLAQNQSP